MNKLWRGGRRHWRGVDWEEKSALTRKRDGNTCQVCGRFNDPKRELASVDHIIPYRLGGTNELVNLLTLCRAPCHARKTGSEPKLLRGDRLGFEQDLRQQNWPMEKVQAAFVHWGKTPQLPLLFRQVGKTQRKFCKRGHAWTEQNIGQCTLITGKILRWCIPCKKGRQPRYSRRSLVLTLGEKSKGYGKPVGG